MRRWLAIALTTVLLGGLASCSDSSSGSSDESEPEGSAARADDRTGGDDAEHRGEGETSGSPGASARDWGDAEQAQARESLLDWKSHPLGDKGPAAWTKGWAGVADSLGKRVVISGPGETMRFKARTGRVQGLEMQWPWAVVYAGGSLTGGSAGAKPGQIAVFDLRDGSRRMVGKEGSAPAPAQSGSVSMHDGELAYATGPNDHYCLAKLDLESLDGQRLGCAKPLKEGLTQFRLTANGLGYTSFDDRRPNSCMTLKTLRGDDSEVLRAAKNCVGWEVVPGEDSVVWLQVRNPNRIERGIAYARTDDGTVHKLGPALSGTTTWCDGSTYYLRPATKDGRADDLMRWSPETGLDVVWTPKRRSMAFVFAPHCGGDTVTLPGFDRDQKPLILSAPTA